jgi:hypothetical protein
MTKPICEEDEFGYTVWRLNGKYHREDGPAVTHPDGYKAWYQYGKYHREDGPAVEEFDSFRWFIHGLKIDLEIALNDSKFQKKYPEIIKSMIVYLVHNS